MENEVANKMEVPGKGSVKWAIVSLVLGIASIVAALWFGGVILGIPAIIAGIVSLRMIKEGKASGKGMSIAGICTGSFALLLTILLVAAGALVPILQSSNEKAKKISCASNLKQIGLALKMYAMDNNEMYPDGKNAAGLEKLRALGYLPDPSIFVCPSSGQTPAAPGCPLTEETCSYLYLGEGKGEMSDSRTIIAGDKPSNHRNYGTVLFADGYVQCFSGADWVDRACRSE